MQAPINKETFPSSRNTSQTRSLLMIGKKTRSKATDRYTFRDAVGMWANPTVYGGTLLERFYSCVLISSHPMREAHDRLARR